MTTFNLTCEAVETTLHEYLDESLEPWLRASIEEHLGECARCSGFARELRSIEREAAALPALLPDREIWPGIADRIGAPVIVSEPVQDSAPLTPTAEPLVLPSDAFVPISERPAFAIEPLVPTVEPALVTSELPMRVGEPPLLRSDEPHVFNSDGPPVLAIPVYVLPPPKEESVGQPDLPTGDLSPPASEPWAPVTEPILPSDAAQTPDIEPPPAILRRREIRWGRERIGLAAAALVLVTAGTTFLLTVKWFGPARVPNVASATGAQRVPSGESAPAELGNRGRATADNQLARDSLTFPPTAAPFGSAMIVSATSALPVTRSPEDLVYDREINVLQKIVRRQKAELDTSTVAVIEKNLGSLDSAIAQIRAALKKDPESSLLDGQASRALEMKVELLRRAAMLRSST
jgi:hypothetical protein